MSLQLEPKKSKWWYGRLVVNGRKINKNLGVEVRGMPPPTLAQIGDPVFERSRSKAQAALDKFQLELKKRSTAEELVQTIYEIRTGGRISSIALDEIGTRWKSLPRRRPLNERYLAQAESWIGKFVKFVAETNPAVHEMAQVQSTMARAYMNAEGHRGVAPKTYNSILIFLRSCFEALKEEGGIPKNPFTGIPTREENTVFRKPFDVDELEQILNAAKSDPFVRPIIIASVCTAMRRGDCCLLLKTAVDMPSRFINVKTSKTGELVQIPIFPLLHDVFEKLEANDSPYMFPEQALKYKVNPDLITVRVRRVLRVAGFLDLKDATSEEERNKARGEIHQERTQGLRKASIRDFHSFRVTWVTLALTAGVPLEIVQKVTGHRTAGIVMKHYFQPGREEFRRTLANKMPALIGGGTVPKQAQTAGMLERLNAMTSTNWAKIREDLVSELRRGKADTVDVEATLTDSKFPVASAA
jgi:integrase